MGFRDRAGLLVAYGRQEVSDWRRERDLGWRPNLAAEREFTRVHASSLAARAEVDAGRARRDAEVWVSVLRDRYPSTFGGLAWEFDRDMHRTFPDWACDVDQLRLWR
jgi:hypothetical protein